MQTWTLAKTQEHSKSWPLPWGPSSLARERSGGFWLLRLDFIFLRTKQLQFGISKILQAGLRKRFLVLLARSSMSLNTSFSPSRIYLSLRTKMRSSQSICLTASARLKSSLALISQTALCRSFPIQNFRNGSWIEWLPGTPKWRFKTISMLLWTRKWQRRSTVLMRCR